MKIWTCGSSLQSGSRNAWAQIKNVNGASRLSKFGIFLVWSKWLPVAIVDHGRNLVISLWPGEKSNNQWSGGKAAHPTPRNSECKNLLEKFSPRFFLESRRHSPHWLPSKGPNYQYGVLLISAGATEGLLKEKCRGKVTKGVLFLHDNAPDHRALATQKKLAYLGFQCLDHPPYSPDVALLDYHLFPGLKKNNWKVAIFRPTQRSLLPRRPGWTDNFVIFFFSGLQKLEQWAKKCIKCRGEYVE